MRLIFITILLLLTSIFASEDSKKPPKEFNEAQKLFEEGDLEGAIEMWQKALEIAPNLGATWFNMGITHDMLGDDSLAIICYNKAAELSPHDPDPWVYMAQLYRRNDNFKMALVAFNQAIQRDSENAFLYNSMAITYDIAGEYKQAIKAIRNALKYDPEYLSLYLNQMIIFNHLEWYDSTKGAAFEFISKQPNEPISLIQLGVAYYELNQPDSALWAIDSALTIYPELGIAHYYRGLIMLAKNDKETAIEEIIQAIELDDAYKEMAREDPELEPIKNDAQLKELISNESEE